MHNVDYERLLALRLTVARYGEMGCAGWWNTKGILGTHGSSLFQRGFPKTHLLAQAQVLFAVAAQRCTDVFSPPGHITLWSLPPVVEDTFAKQWSECAQKLETLRPMFQRLQSIENKSLLELLRDQGLIDTKLEKEVQGLRPSANNRAVLVPGRHQLDDRLLSILAAAFSRGSHGEPVIPYAAVDAP